MFYLVRRTDTIPEFRVLINTDHIVGVAPVSGGVKSRLFLSTGETWEVELAFNRAINLLRGPLDVVEPAAPAGPGGSR